MEYINQPLAGSLSMHTEFCNCLLNALGEMYRDGYKINPKFIEEFDKMIKTDKIMRNQTQLTIYLSNDTKNYYLEIYSIKKSLYGVNICTCNEKYDIRYKYTNTVLEDIKVIVNIFQDISNITDHHNHHNHDDFIDKISNSNILSKEKIIELYSLYYNYYYSDYPSIFDIIQEIEDIHDNMYLFIFQENSYLYIFKKNYDNNKYELYTYTDHIKDIIKEFKS